jgi:hypothetical protein
MISLNGDILMPYRRAVSLRVFSYYAQVHCVCQPRDKQRTGCSDSEAQALEQGSEYVGGERQNRKVMKVGKTKKKI